MKKPVALQLGGIDPSLLADCAAKAEQLGFAEINLNLGCPSDKVQKGNFGACLMSSPREVAMAFTAMKKRVNIPVTAKTRIGIDQMDSYAFFKSFITELVNAGVDKIIVHARKAWLTGLNPKQNRSIPPLHYDFVYQIKEDFPHIPFVINGQINSIHEAQNHLTKVDGIMVGRLACQNPYAIASLHSALYLTIQSLPDFKCYNFTLKRCSKQIMTSSGKLLKPILNMAHGLPSARQWKETLTSLQKKALGIKEFTNELMIAVRYFEHFE